MRRVVKRNDSKIISDNIKYSSSKSNLQLGRLLLNEQKKFCAYTEEYISFNDAYDIEHFNPNLKNTDKDNYDNWFCVKHRPNLKKASKWKTKILYPTQEDFEKRIIYIDGFFLLQDSKDEEAQNLIDLLDLNNEIFVNDRKRYIDRRKEGVEIYNISPIKYFQLLIDKEIELIRYLRAIQTEFAIDIWSMIPNVEE